MKVAVTVTFAFIVTTHVPVPAQPPPVHPIKVLFTAGVAVRVTTAPPEKFAKQVTPHLRPTGLDATVPAPVPFLDTDSCAVTGNRLKVAVI